MIRRFLLIGGFFMFCSNQGFAGYTKIESLDDCDRVANNVSIFWKSNTALISKINKGSDISKDDICSSADSCNRMIIEGMIQEFREGKSSGSLLKESMDFVSKNADKIKAEFNDDTRYLNLSKGLEFLSKLINSYQPPKVE